MRNAIILALVASTALASPLLAEEMPRPGPHDPRIQYVVYDPTNVVKVLGTDLRSTLIQFGPTEVVELVAVGDLKAWSWQKAKNLLFVKPAVMPMRDSNMQVVTVLPDGTQRVYQFALVGQPENVTDPVYGINFTYPADVAAARSKAAEERRAQEEADLARQRLEVDYFYGNRNWKFMARGSKVLCPSTLEVSDNGEVTIFRFPGNTKLPAIYEITPDGHEQLTNSTVSDDLTVVHDTAHAWRLRMGNEVCDIWNVGYDAVGSNSQTGTISPEVVRTVKGSRR